MPFIPDQPSSFVPDKPSTAPSAPMGPYRYLSASGQPVESATPYQAERDPFASQGVGASLARNLPRSPALPLAGGIVAPMLGAPALVGQMAAGGLGGALSMPEHPLLGAALESTLIGLLGGAGGLTGKALGRRAGAFEYAQGKLKEAADAVRDRVPQALKFFEIPSLSKAKMTFDEAVEALSKARKQDFADGLKEFVGQLDQLELKEPVGRAGTAGAAFASRAPDYLRDPGEFAQLAHSIASTPEGRLALGVPGLGLGLAAKEMAPGALRWILQRVLP